jgi:hypothetical protein
MLISYPHLREDSMLSSLRKVLYPLTLLSTTSPKKNWVFSRNIWALHWKRDGFGKVLVPQVLLSSLFQRRMVHFGSVWIIGL